MDVSRFLHGVSGGLLIAGITLAAWLLHAPDATAATRLTTAATRLTTAAAPLATASTRRMTATIPSVDTVQVGPITAADGFSLYLTAQNCGSSEPGLRIAYLTGGSADVLSHTYTGASASCSIQKAPAGAELRVDLPGFIDVAVQIGKTQPALLHPGLPVGCTAPYGPELPAIAVGHIDVSIHPDVFGRISAGIADARIFSGAPQACPGRPPTDGRELTADIGPYILDADQPTRGAAQLEILDASGDSPSPDLQGVLEVELGGHAALGVNATNASTRIGATTRLTTGSLSFAVLPVCPGHQAQNGTLDGTLTIEDPLLGPLRIDGTDASAAFSGQGSAQPGSCDGPGSQPVMPELVSTCDQEDAGCSVSADAGVVTFFDETSPGTQTITSEVVNFGDGSTPVAITNYGSAQHAYTAAGVYTASLSVTDAVGASFIVTTPVVIDP